MCLTLPPIIRFCGIGTLGRKAIWTRELHGTSAVPIRFRSHCPLLHPISDFNPISIPTCLTPSPPVQPHLFNPIPNSPHCRGNIVDTAVLPVSPLPRNSLIQTSPVDSIIILDVILLWSRRITKACILSIVEQKL